MINVKVRQEEKMTETKIMIGENEFVLDESGDYVGKMTVWGREILFLNS